MNERRVPEALIGVYVATVLGPAVALWGHGTDRISLLGAAAVAAGAGALAVLAARSVEDLPARLASLRVAAVTVLPPLSYLPYMVLSTAPESTPALLSVVGLLAVVPGVFVPVSGAVVRSRRLRAGATELAVVTVGDDSDGGDGDDNDGRNLQVVAAATVAALSVVGFGAFVLFVGEPGSGTFVTTMGGLSTTLLLLADDDGTELAVTDAGLRIERTITAWDDFQGYRVTDDSVQFVRPQWYLPARSFEREKISDEDALLDGVSEFLPRLDEQGRVEMTARRGERVA